jgi:putative membrane protein
MFKRILIGGSLALSFILGTGAILRADDLSSQDKEFVATAASAGMLEVQLGQFAAQNASNGEVKKFGAHMVDDHSRANEELKTLAAEKSIEIPGDLSDKHKEVRDRLEKLSGGDFDKAYVAQMVEDHQKVVSAFEKEASDGGNDALKGFAQKTLPVLRHHLEMAQDLAKTINH